MKANEQYVSVVLFVKLYKVEYGTFLSQLTGIKKCN